MMLFRCVIAVAALVAGCVANSCPKDDITCASHGSRSAMLLQVKYKTTARKGENDGDGDDDVDPFLDRDFVTDSSNPLDDSYKFADGTSSNETSNGTSKDTESDDSSASRGNSTSEGSKSGNSSASGAKSEDKSGANSTAAKSKSKSEAKSSGSDNITSNSSDGKLESWGNKTNKTLSKNKTSKANGTNLSASCATRAEKLADASWKTAAVAKPGTPCMFGLDDRDEGEHCIYENGDYGSFGWCWTAKDKSEWGSCNEACPMSGPFQVIDKRLRHIEDILAPREKSANTSSSNTSQEESDTSPPLANSTSTPEATGDNGTNSSETKMSETKTSESILKDNAKKDATEEAGEKTEKHDQAAETTDGKKVEEYVQKENEQDAQKMDVKEKKEKKGKHGKKKQKTGEKKAKRHGHHKKRCKGGIFLR
eukprot:gnl/TRDRNA2_/TRDRNA2_84016_c0_seq1.p1 gnl/TRDRNA2_/TRDRNA2_84016_c0~~gnl/TRDRNA2_/TRDRNA2_84016_c0_seq1.p1  ORF type:complete len:424 (-),score=102.92 gnl/TRDRNA2_/TRDRNA2_84016_c0_seq1:396-1667(-)